MSPPPSSPVMTFELIGSTSQRRMPRLFAGACEVGMVCVVVNVVVGFPTPVWPGGDPRSGWSWRARAPPVMSIWRWK